MITDEQVAIAKEAYYRLGCSVRLNDEEVRCMLQAVKPSIVVNERVRCEQVVEEAIYEKSCDLIQILDKIHNPQPLVIKR